MTKTLHEIAGSIVAGCSSTLLGHPLDTVKVHQQTLSSGTTAGRGASAIHVARSLTKHSNFALFRGIGPPMMNQIIMNTVMFSVFHKMKAATNENSIFGMGENSSAMCAGLFSGFATACVSTPLDWIKIQAQLSSSQGITGKQNHTMSVLRQLMQNNNYNVMAATRTLYRGHVPNLAREGVFTMVYLGLYDRISDVVIKGNPSNDGKLNSGQIIVISSFTGACAWIFNYPFDTMKTVMQGGKIRREKIPVGTAFQTIWHSGGFRGFFRGIQASTLRAMMVTSSRMLAYEKTIQLLKE